MTTSVDDLRAVWASLHGVPRGDGRWRASRLREVTPVAVLAALRDADDAAAIIFETQVSEAPVSRIRFASQGVSLLEQRDRAEGLFRIVLALERSEFESIFEVLALDLVAVAASAGRVQAAWRALSARIDAWQACLRARDRPLGREALVGLAGELLCLRRIATLNGYDAAVGAWEGPGDGLHDFRGDTVAFEVKTRTGGDTRIRVQGLDQLDTSGLERLLVLRPVLGLGPDGRSVPEIVAGIRDEIARVAPAALSGFEDRLLRAGYLDGDAAGHELRVALDELRIYRVEGAFPRLTRASVDPGIVDAAYVVDEKMLAPFLAPACDADALLAIGGGVRP